MRRDEQGYLYFVGRRDEMIKTSGYRVSPRKWKRQPMPRAVGDAVATGVPHEKLGQVIVLIASPAAGAAIDDQALLACMKRLLPNYRSFSGALAGKPAAQSQWQIRSPPSRCRGEGSVCGECMTITQFWQHRLAVWSAQGDELLVGGNKLSEIAADRAHPFLCL